jgi:hypothetical protein
VARFYPRITESQWKTNPVKRLLFEVVRKLLVDSIADFWKRASQHQPRDEVYG